jgi:hypothetical protein
MAQGPAQAGTLENLERERAIFIDSLLDPDASPTERQDKISISKRRLVDLERMVLRDKSLTGRNTPTVRRAFENYDLTFLVHASTEKNVSAIDAWLGEIGITTQSLMSAEMGRR